MGFTMAPAFYSSDLDRPSKFWGALGFTVVLRHEGYMILEHPIDPDANALRVGGPAEPS